MQPNFSIKVELDRNLVRIWLGGFFGPDDVTEFVKARDRAHQQLRCGANEHITLVDIRDMAIQPQETVAAFRQALSNPAMASRRLAFVTARSLSQMQIKRAASSRDAAYFAFLWRYIALGTCNRSGV